MNRGNRNVRVHMLLSEQEANIIRERMAELGLILRRLHLKRDRQANVGDFEQHIESLQKSSVRNKLQRAKSEVKPSEPKPPKKKEPSL